LDQIGDFVSRHNCCKAHQTVEQFKMLQDFLLSCNRWQFYCFM